MLKLHALSRGVRLHIRIFVASEQMVKIGHSFYASRSK